MTHIKEHINKIMNPEHLKGCRNCKHAITMGKIDTPCDPCTSRTLPLSMWEPEEVKGIGGTQCLK